MAMLMLASSIHSMPAAIHKLDERGMKKSPMDASTAPARKYGRRRPSQFQVRSDIYPITGCTSRPVSGAAIHSPAMSSTWAPSVWKMRLTLAFCSAKPNCRPRNPKHMFQMCQKVSEGRALAAGAAALIPCFRSRCHSHADHVAQGWQLDPHAAWRRWPRAFSAQGLEGRRACLDFHLHGERRCRRIERQQDLTSVAAHAR